MSLAHEKSDTEASQQDATPTHTIEISLTLSEEVPYVAVMLLLDQSIAEIIDTTNFNPVVGADGIFSPECLTGSKPTGRRKSAIQWLKKGSVVAFTMRGTFHPDSLSMGAGLASLVINARSVGLGIKQGSVSITQINQDTP